VRLSCLARNGRSPGEESLTAAIAVQAIEAQPAFGQIKPMRGQVLACAEQHFGEVPASDRPTQEALRSRRAKRNPGVQKGAPTCRRADRIQRWRRDAPDRSRSKRLPGSIEVCVAPRHHCHIDGLAIRADPDRDTTDPWSHLPLVTAPIGDWAEPGATLPPGAAGSVRIDTGAQAVHPTVMAPKTANTSRHQPEGTPT
jgi:hypothetical protein